jgi:Rieske Fe-S protein
LLVTELTDPVRWDAERFVIKADLMTPGICSKTARSAPSICGMSAIYRLHDVCPHLGCKVNYQPSEAHFHCPCHASTFGLDGVKINKIPPRDLDHLETKVQHGKVWVKYQDFRGGVAEKIPT